MSDMRTSPGVAFRCDTSGIVLEVLCDHFGLTRPPRPGHSAAEMLLPADRDKFARFLGVVATERAAFEWTLHVESDAGERPLDFAGALSDGGILVMAAADVNEVARLAERFTEMNSELVNVVRELRRRDSISRKSLEGFSALNNELVNLQRELSRKNRELEQSERFLQSILDTTPAAVFSFELPGLSVVFANKAVVRILGVSDKNLLGELSGHDRALLGLNLERQGDGWLSRIVSAEDGAVIAHEYEARSALGETRWFECYDTVLARDGDGYPKQILRVSNDITARHILERELVMLANTDSLTGVWNRRHMMDTARAEIGRARRHGHSLALIVADLDGLKSLNDSLGHAAGDAAIKHFAQIASSKIRESDSMARFGGDEFVILLPETDLTGATELADRMVEALRSEPAHLGTSSVIVTCSFGAAELHGEKDNLDALLGRADAALYRAKAKGPAHVVGT
jgi:diguanylate cyclase (GGDEF)-like protein/PAS domain S-box-containing protein